MQRITIGLDIAKSVFQVHGEDASGNTILQKRLRRSQVLGFFAGLEPALIGIEACGSAHYWGRELRALGHEVRLIPGGLREAVRAAQQERRARCGGDLHGRQPAGHGRFVAIKSVESPRSLARARALARVAGPPAHPADEQRAQPAGRIRHHCGARAARLCSAERTGCRRRRTNSGDPAPVCCGPAAATDRPPARALPPPRSRQRSWPWPRPIRRCGGSPPSPASAGSPPTPSSPPSATASSSASSRDFAAWCGLTPRGASSGLKRREGGISRQGDIRLRKLLALGASTIIRNARSRADRATEWQRGILARRPVKPVAVLAQAAKTARIAWAMLTAGTTYRQPAGAAPAQPV